jgi:hypothetical protein
VLRISSFSDFANLTYRQLPAANRRNDGDFGAISENQGIHRIFMANGDHRMPQQAGQSWKLARELAFECGNGGTLRQFAVERILPNKVTRGSEKAESNSHGG